MGWLGTALGGIGGFLVGGPLGGIAGAGLGSKLGGGGKDEGHPEDPYTAALGHSAQESQAEARSLGNSGTDTLAPVLAYFKQLTSQNPAAIMDATRPERARVIDQYDTARKSIANFAPRGGGSVSANAQSQFDQAESLADVTSSARSAAFTGASALGVSQIGLSLSAKQLASADLNTLISTILKREGLDTEKRGQNMALAGDIGETIGTLIGLGMGGGG